MAMPFYRPQGPARCAPCSLGRGKSLSFSAVASHRARRNIYCSWGIRISFFVLFLILKSVADTRRIDLHKSYRPKTPQLEEYFKAVNQI
jgi:hypothetical protein